MEMQEAIQIIEHYQVRNQLAGFLEALIEMGAQFMVGDLFGGEALAYRVFMAAGQQMFAPV